MRPGQNTISRRSVDSSVTIPYEQTFRKIERSGLVEGSDAEASYNICGCGWPQHMLIPKGIPGGMAVDLFAMVSDYEQDEVPQNLGSQCKEAASYCGIKDKLYPDKRAMGFPFDRLGRQGTGNLASFLTPNMRAVDISINFNDRVAQRT